MTWGALFDRAAARPDAVTVDDVRRALGDRRAGADEGVDGATAGSDGAGDVAPPDTEAPVAAVPDEPDPTRIVADADVLAADLLVGGDARGALDPIRAHDWVALVASEPLLDDAEAVVAALADASLAADWRERVESATVPVVHPAGDHPGLASAARGGAAHLLSFDEALTSANANLALQGRVSVSVRTPAAFASVFDPARLYPSLVGGEYPGPDADPRG